MYNIKSLFAYTDEIIWRIIFGGGANRDMHAAFLHMQIFAPIYDFIQHFSYMLNYVGMLTLYEKFFASANICRDVNKIQRLLAHI